MLARLGDVDFVAKEIGYHGICRTKYQTQAEQISKKTPAMKTPSNWHKIYIMNDLNDQYVAILSDLSAEQDCSPTSTTQSLETKIKQHFKDKVQIQKGKTKRGNLIFSSKVTVEEALRKEHLIKTKLTNKMKDVAMALRAALEILNSILCQRM